MRLIQATLVLALASSLLIAAGCSTYPNGYTQIDSTNIAAVKYDTATGAMSIKFISGEIYNYRNIPQKIYNDFMAAESKGKYYSANIKGQYE